MLLPAVVRFNAEAESVQKAHRLDRMSRAMFQTPAQVKPPLAAIQFVAVAIAVH